jgi:IS30 family transposase
VQLRKTLLLPLDDLLAVTCEFLCAGVSRSGLNRCLRRQARATSKRRCPSSPANLPRASSPMSQATCMWASSIYRPDESQRRHLFVAVDRATRWVLVQIKSSKIAANARAFVKALHQACPIKISKMLTGNGKEFTDRLFASGKRDPTW